VETRPLAVVTGASEGIGRDLAACYARDGYDLVLIARRAELLQELATELERTTGAACRVLPADLARAEECERVADALMADRARVRALVNNAGLGTHGWFHEIPMDRQRMLIEVNVTALTHLTSRILPWLRQSGGGHVMNVASVASFQPGPLMATYYASKAYVLSLSEALHNECRGTGVTVTAVCPGPTRTGFQRSAGISSRARSGGAPAMDSPTVARLAYAGAKAGKAVVATGFRNWLAALFGRYLPRSWTTKAVRSIQLARLRAGEEDVGRRPG
jgi:hypothetical protein